LPAKVARLVRDEFDGLHWRLRMARLVAAPLPNGVGGRIRALLLHLSGFRIDRSVVLLGMPEITGPRDLYRNLEIRHGVVLNAGCVLELGAKITIEEGAGLGHEVAVLTTTHEIGDERQRWGRPVSLPVRIGSGAWLCSRCMVLPGVEVGPGAVVGAGALVTRDVAPNTLVGGVPARLIRRLGEPAPTGVPEPEDERIPELVGR
jgi:acetyltransferase-like isoleucine patch superfamily enzyme